MIRRVVGAVKRYNTYNRTCRELSRLSDHELNDLGIARGEIRRIAMEAGR